jgi:hypothetical protein
MLPLSIHIFSRFFYSYCIWVNKSISVPLLLCTRLLCNVFLEITEIIFARNLQDILSLVIIELFLFILFIYLLFYLFSGQS